MFCVSVVPEESDVFSCFLEDKVFEVREGKPDSSDDAFVVFVVGIFDFVEECCEVVSVWMQVSGLVYVRDQF